MFLLVGSRGAATTLVVALLLISSVPANADDTRVEERPYVATPGNGFSNDNPSFARIALEPGETQIAVTIDDAIAQHTEGSVAFTSEDHPFARAVTFCRHVTLSIPWWADTVSVYTERLGGSGVGLDGGSMPEDTLRELLEGPGDVIDDTPLAGTPVGELIKDRLNHQSPLLPELEFGNTSTCPDSGHAATAGIITARIS